MFGKELCHSRPDAGSTAHKCSRSEQSGASYFTVNIQWAHRMSPTSSEGLFSVMLAQMRSTSKVILQKDKEQEV